MAILDWRWKPSWSLMTRNRRLFVIAIIAVAVIGVVITIISQVQQSRLRARTGPADGPVPVVAAAAKLADVPV